LRHALDNNEMNRLMWQL